MIDCKRLLTSPTYNEVINVPDPAAVPADVVHARVYHDVEDEDHSKGGLEGAPEIVLQHDEVRMKMK